MHTAQFMADASESAYRQDIELLKRAIHEEINTTRNMSCANIF